MFGSCFGVGLWDIHCSHRSLHWYQRSKKLHCTLALASYRKPKYASLQGEKSFYVTTEIIYWGTIETVDVFLKTRQSETWQHSETQPPLLSYWLPTQVVANWFFVKGFPIKTFCWPDAFGCPGHRPRHQRSYTFVDCVLHLRAGAAWRSWVSSLITLFMNLTWTTLWESSH